MAQVQKQKEEAQEAVTQAEMRLQSAIRDHEREMTNTTNDFEAKLRMQTD